MREQLGKNPKEPRLLYQSVLIYTLAEDRATAIKNTKAALEGGYKPHWFAGSALRWLHEDPEVGPLLRGARQLELRDDTPSPEN